jgi:hypothetical protein
VLRLLRKSVCEEEKNVQYTTPIRALMSHIDMDEIIKCTNMKA